PTYPLRKLWKKVVKNCRRKYHPRRQLALDEAMIRYKGHKSPAKKIFMPCKPIRNGFKVYALCDSLSGFMVNFVLHVTTTHKRTILDTAMLVAKPFIQLYHHIFTDRYYTSVNLAERLLQATTYLTGAIRTNARGLPSDLSPNPRRNPNRYTSIKNMKKTGASWNILREAKGSSHVRSLARLQRHQPAIVGPQSVAKQNDRRYPQAPAPEESHHDHRCPASSYIIQQLHGRR
ncbi:unnamed protein product, partial [marine sediment metagenome]